MKKLSVLFLAVCLLFAVGCSNEVTKINNITADDLRATKTIVELGGTPDSSEEGIADFLSVSDYQGVFATEGGFVGYKIKDSKIYFVAMKDTYNDVWTEITNGISVDKNLNKLEYQTDSGLEILTFDGFGYRSYHQDEERAIYYKKSDYLEKFEGIYWNGKTDIGINLVVNSDGSVTRYNYDKDKKVWTSGRYTSMVVLNGLTLTFKGADGAVFMFDPDYQNIKGEIVGGANYKGTNGWHWLSKVDKLTLD